MADLLLSLAVGLGAGVLSGMFGIGGGLVTTPAIRLLLGYPALIAVGTPLPVIIPTAITGAFAYVRRGSADVRTGMVVGLVGSLLSVAGAVASNQVGGAAVMYVTAVVILIAAADMFAQSRQAASLGGEDEPPADEHVSLPEAASRLASDEAVVESTSGAVHPRPRGTVAAVALGVVAGLYSGFLGLGGGFVVVPALTRWFGMPVKRAIGTSLIAVAIMAVPGSITHWFLGHVDLEVAVGLVVGSVPGAIAGAALTAVAHERHVRIAFAVLLVVTAVLLGGSELARSLS